MAKPLIPLTEANMKAIKNFIGMCRMNGLEGPAEPSFNFKDSREDIGLVIIDLYFDARGISETLWKITVRADTDVRFHDDVPAEEGQHFNYRDMYHVKTDSLELIHKNSDFKVFSW